MSLASETAPAPLSVRLANTSNERLADMIGDADITAKAEAAYLDKLKDEAKRRGIEMATGSRFKITMTVAETKRLDTKAIPPKMAAKLAPYYKMGISNTLRISSVFTPAELD